jgi:hypothetical protein
MEPGFSYSRRDPKSKFLSVREDAWPPPAAGQDGHRRHDAAQGRHHHAPRRGAQAGARAREMRAQGEALLSGGSTNCCGATAWPRRCPCCCDSVNSPIDWDIATSAQRRCSTQRSSSRRLAGACSGTRARGAGPVAVQSSFRRCANGAQAHRALRCTGWNAVT